MPDSEIFLDSDDLMDLRDLLEHVKTSDVLLLFQTKSVLQRPWCLLELFAAIEAGEAGADYVAFGAFFQTQSKTPRSRATPEILEWWRQLSIVQSVAIGGITADNCAPLVRAGADFLAVIAAVWDHPDGPGAGVKAINDAIAEVATA